MTLRDLDPDLADILYEAGALDLDTVRAKGREFWLEHFANLEGFAFDFNEQLEQLGISWEEASSHPALKGDLFELEINVRTLDVLQQAGLTSMADAFLQPRTVWRNRIARATGLFDLLEAAMAWTEPDPAD